MATNGAISVYGIGEPTKEDYKRARDDERNGIVRYHETTWLEWQLPIEVEKEAEKFIEERLIEFHKNCKCENCKSKREKSE